MILIETLIIYCENYMKIFDVLKNHYKNIFIVLISQKLGAIQIGWSNCTHTLWYAAMLKS